MWQTVIVKGIPIEMPGYLAERLLRAGVAHLLEVSDLPIPTDSESSGIATHLGLPPDTVSKPRKSSKGSQKKTTK
jgi:hypothetical protein